MEDSSAIGTVGSSTLVTSNVNGSSNVTDVNASSNGTNRNDAEEGYAQDVNPRTLSLAARQSVRVASAPCAYFWSALVTSLILSVVGMWIGEFRVEVEGAGWLSRGTTISDRHTQFILVNQHQDELFASSSSDVWEDLITNVQPGWETDEDEEEDEESRRRRKLNALLPSSQTEGRRRLRRLPVALDAIQRHLEEVDTSQEDAGVLEGCDVSWYTSEMIFGTRLWPTWKPIEVEEPNTLIRKDVLRDLCLSEEANQRVLADNGHCLTCGEGGSCIPPYSIVLFARLTVTDGLSVDCETLAELWEDYNEENPNFENQLVNCTSNMELEFDFYSGTVPEPCPEMFYPYLVDSDYSATAQVAYTSTVFATIDSEKNIERMYDNVDAFDRGSSNIQGAFDTQEEDFLGFFADAAIGMDMSLALGSAIVTTAAIVIHTRSCFLTVVGLLQIILSFPLSFFVYKLVAGIDFFPFLNFIGVFVVFAIGADGMFVAVDKWKNARIKFGNHVSVQKIASEALPDAAGAMFLTTLTTAVAFFGTALCPVAPIKCFSIFCGLLIVLDYIMIIVLVFPALCIYDSKRFTKNCCCHCTCCCGGGTDDDDAVEAHLRESQGEGETKESPVRRILGGFYYGLHLGRYPLLAVSVGAFILSTIYAVQMELPTSSDVRILNSNIEYEQSFLWREKLLSTSIQKKEGSSAYIIWGTTAADTGDHLNPESFSQLVLDDTFEPSDPGAQTFLLGFCDELFANEWAILPSTDDNSEHCYMQALNEWLQEQSGSESPDQIYVDNCGDATGIPVAEADFHACVSNWALATNEKRILARDGTVEIMFLDFMSRVRFDSPFDVLDDEWQTIEAWSQEQRDAAPPTASGLYFTSEDFWWYDTNGSMLNTAVVAAGIAIATAAVVILFSSRSLVLTLFSAFTITYVLTSVTAVLVSFGWTLGFLEAICFAILIGLSCDFVIHFAHAYSSQQGHIDRSERTKYALIMMGPSILAAGVTTIAAAIVMLFTVITFFQKFGIVLFVTVVQAVLGSFIIFLVLTDTLGPSNPTYLVDMVTAKLFDKKDLDDKEVARTEHMNEAN